MSLLLWDELAALWQAGDFRAVHDWLNERWARAVQQSPRDDGDPFARFLQGLGFAALAFHFAAEHNSESAGIFVEDALEVLPQYVPAYAGIEIDPIVDALAELRDRLPAPETGLPVPAVASSVRALRFSARA
ncbi:MAG: DUF309 domain-containing protein [Gemmatimonadetes bacterium]|nr:DUF309 domain-containing protein [Gemmatimonadota bacterium]NIR82699.1 DUF309 domain-containing protein [Gammaproteobacteria bacterium]